MKGQINLNKFLVIVTAFVFLTGGCLFYWYEYRPAMIRGDCSIFAEKESKKDAFVYEIIYRLCVRKHGIEYNVAGDQKEE
jgi:hypothetical protein